MPAVPKREYTDFAVQRIIIGKVTDRRLGFESDEDIQSWKWDKKYVFRDRKMETLPCPGLRPSSFGAIPDKFWNNGPLSEKQTKQLKVEGVVETFSGESDQWAPVIKSGTGYMVRQPVHLFSDDSVVENVTASSIDSSGRSVHTLNRVPRPGKSITATIFKRSTGENIPWREYQHRYSFTGVYDSDGEESTTRIGDTLYWDNVDTTKREFIVSTLGDTTKLLFNQSAIEQITSVTAPSALSDFNDLEYLGDSDGGDNQRFESDVFPISDDSYVKVYVVNTDVGSWKEYSIVDSFTTYNQVKVDTDHGIITFADSTCGVPDTNLAIYLAYRAVPRVEYEEDGFGDETVAVDANVNPMQQSLNRGFVVLSRSDLDVSEIILSTVKERYKGKADTFGPISVGSDYAPLEALVLSEDGQPVPNVKVNFELVSTPNFGTIAGVATEMVSASLANGKAYSSYIPPVDVNSMGFFISSLAGSNLIEVDAEAQFDDVDSVYTYLVLKDDPWKGKVGADTSIGEIPWVADPPNGRKVILYSWDATAINPITGRLGAYAPVRPSSISGGYQLYYPSALDVPDPSNVVGTDNLGAYWIVSDRFVDVQASVFSPKLNRTIFSNIITLRVEIPSYMKGSYINEALQEIPFGWRLRDDNYEVASAIGGATFISINPVAGPYPIIDVIGGETWDSPTDYSWGYNEVYPATGVTRPFAVITLSWEVA